MGIQVNDYFSDSKYSRGVSSAWRTFAKANPMTKLAACAFLALAVKLRASLGLDELLRLPGPHTR